MTAIREPLKPRPDWTLVPPDDSGTWEPLAYIVGPEGVDMYWIPKGVLDDPNVLDPTEHYGEEIPWPFDWEASATPEDFVSLGFRIEY